MQTTANQPSKKTLWISWFMSGLVILFMVFDGVFKFIQPEPVLNSMLELGYGEHHIAIVGALALIAVIFYAIPRTTILGAILLTGFLGGAMATNFRVNAPLFTHVLFPAYLLILAWGGLWLRNERVRNIIPYSVK